MSGPGQRLHAIDKQTQSLVYVGDAEDDEEDLEVDMNMLWRCVSPVNETIPLQTSHFFVFYLKDTLTLTLREDSSTHMCT